MTDERTTNAGDGDANTRTGAGAGQGELDRHARKEALISRVA